VGQREVGADGTVWGRIRIPRPGPNDRAIARRKQALNAKITYVCEAAASRSGLSAWHHAGVKKSTFEAWQKDRNFFYWSDDDVSDAIDARMRIEGYRRESQRDNDLLAALVDAAELGLQLYWTRSTMAERTGLSKSTIGRIWKAFNLKPHRTDGFKLSNDPLFVEKVVDLVGLYLNPPENAVVYSADENVDEKSQVQALARSQPAFPMMPGMPEKRTHDYVRHDTTTLFAAMDVADGTVIGKTYRSHRASEFKKFLALIDAQVPADVDVHVICDNYSTHNHPTVQTWLGRHPRFTMHFTPTYSSWLNQVERLFVHVTDDLLRRSDHRSVQALEADLRAWVKAWNENPKPFVWTNQDRRRDPRIPRPTYPTYLRRRTLDDGELGRDRRRAADPWGRPRRARRGTRR
jgi:transposase